MEFAAWLLDASLESEIIRPRATVWPMTSDSLKVPGWDSATHSSTLFGGLVGTWLAELGKRVLFTEKVPALGTKGDLMLCDLSQYAIGLRKEVSLDKSLHVGWTTDQSSYRAILRADGIGTWDRAITPKAGDSLSWCVALGART